MKKYPFLVLLAMLLFIAPLSAQNDLHKGLMKNYDVKHYNLDLEVSNTSASVSGNVTILADVVSAKLDTFVIELINNTGAINYTYMHVDSVKINQQKQPFSHTNDLIIIPLVNSIEQGKLFAVQVFYHGLATAFEYQKTYDGFSLVNNGIVVVKSQKQSFSNSESRGAKIWWPCKQDLTDKADSVTFNITTEATNKSASNGLLKSTRFLPNNKVKYRWETKYPIDYYLISFAVGPFTESVTYAPLKSTNDSVMIQSFLNVNSRNYQKNIKGIEVTKKLITVYSDLLGDYPFKKEKYGYCAVDTLLDGMENQTITTINSNVLDTIPSSFSYYNSSWVSAHELAHHWFGDYVTCKTWNDCWINEGFATYMEYVALQKFKLDALAKEWMNATHLTASFYTRSIYVPDSALNEDSRVFSFGLTYKKGASILHILRYETNNDSVFFKGIRNYLDHYHYSVASAADFKLEMEKASGLNLTTFFNQWYYGEGYPFFNLQWNQKTDTLTLISKQTTATPTTPLFKTHFDVKLNFTSSDTLIRLYQDANIQTFKIPIKKEIVSIEIDPNEWILKQVKSISTGISTPLTNSISSRVYPNPFTESSNIEFYLKKAQPVRVEIINLNGSIIETKTIKGIEGQNITNTGSSLSKGVYFYRIIINDSIETFKLIKQ